ncbi:DUF6308 family protein [Isoptericola sp. b408]|uniref:DUF6308 family protein n=1 Tax=Isoptericola sp. b408 TaxID=3064653 RepID=UPI0027142FB2|nr:DUF6308 family protein [Isoptericola sp. b408]MDO8150183.1 DUF6308 family protein [Isoptericola sp. b408]
MTDPRLKPRASETHRPLPDIVTERRRADAVQHLQRYFRDVTATSGWAGSRFERLAGGGDAPGVVDHFTADDLVAVSLLSVEVPPLAALQILESRKREIDTLLAALPDRVDLVDVDPSTIDESWPAWRLWSELRSVPGIGWVTAGKLLARKRPHLVPVYDTVVQRAVNPDGSFWVWLASALRADDRALHRHLLSLREEAGIGHDISALRVFDVAVWMDNQNR